MASVSESGGIEILNVTNRIVVEKIDKERFTITKSDKGDLEFLCNVCAMAFDKQQGVKNHITRIHIKVKVEIEKLETQLKGKKRKKRKKNEIPGLVVDGEEIEITRRRC